MNSARKSELILRIALSLIALLLGVTKSIAAQQITVYVSIGGDDRNTGLSLTPGADGPVATPARAIAIVKTLKAQGRQGVQFIIQLSPGTYRLGSPLQLDGGVSGTSEAPTIVQGSGSDPDKVLIVGTLPLIKPMAELPSSVRQRLTPEAVRHVVAFDLKENRVPAWTAPVKHGFPIATSDNGSELFVGGEPQSMAAWPKTGYAKITAPPDGKNGLRLSIDSQYPARWQNLDMAWADGYFYWDYADTHVPLASKSVDGGTFTLAEAPSAGYGIRVGQRIRFANIPEELNGPGSWYFDYRQGIAYVWLTNPQQPGNVEFSVAPSLAHISSASHLRVRNIAFDGARLDLIDADGVQDVVIDHCNLRNSGKAAVQISGSSSGVTYSNILNAGSTGISLSGGDRATLQAANLFADNNTISNFSRVYRTYQPAILLSGVGNRAEHNRIHDAPHMAIYFIGNDHVINYNNISNVAVDTDDAGAIYGGRDWTQRGTQIKYNYLHNIHGVGAAGATGVYVDDQGSGVTVYGNIFFDVFQAMEFGGGLDNSIEGNIIVKSKTPIFFDNRGMNWEKAQTTDPKSFLQIGLAAVPYQNEIWRRRYPELAQIVTDGLGTPRRNFIWANLVVQSGPIKLDMPAEVLALQKVGSNMVDDDPGFVDKSLSQSGEPPATAFELAAGSKALLSGMKQIPVREIEP